MRGKWAGLVVVVGCLAVFLGLALQIKQGDSAVWRFDRSTAEELKAHAEAHPDILRFATIITDAGGIPVMLAVAVVGSLLLWMCAEPRLAAVWILAAALGAGVNQGTKRFIDRPRPGEGLRDQAVHERNASYPSGHAMGATIGYGTLGFVGLVLLRKRAAKVALAMALAVLVLTIGASRIYLRAHWCSDVAGGFAIGAAWLALCITLTMRRVDS